MIWNFSKVRSSLTDSVSLGGFPTNLDYIMSSKEEEVVDAEFMHRRQVARGRRTSRVLTSVP